MAKQFSIDVDFRVTKPFWQLPSIDEVNRQMREIQDIPYLIRQRHPEYANMKY